MDLTQKLTGIVRIVKASIKLDSDSKESKSVYLALDYSDCTIDDLLTKSCSHDKISWANGGSGRANYSSIVSGSTIKVKASAPGMSPQVDPVTACIASAAASGMSIEAWLKAEVAKRTAPKLEPLK